MSNTTHIRPLKEVDPRDAAIAAEIRAEIGRQRSVQSVISLEAFKRPQQWLNRRLNAEVAFTAAEVLTIADYLNVDVIDWINAVKNFDPSDFVRRQGLEPRTRWLNLTAA